ncbi:MAG: hypothetical protein ABR584_12670 [Candidatus Baltobacteraceae bacterium]
MRRATSLFLGLTLLGAANSSVSSVDAYARAGGTNKPLAVRVGKKLFQHEWPAQILKIYVDSAGRHHIAGVMISGVKFHHALSHAQFLDEIVGIVDQAFLAAPLEEVDVWCVVPLNVGKGVIVNGDHAQPTARSVFTVTVRRGESSGALRARIAGAKTVYWDTLWAKEALQRG